MSILERVNGLDVSGALIMFSSDALSLSKMHHQYVVSVIAVPWAIILQVMDTKKRDANPETYKPVMYKMTARTLFEFALEQYRHDEGESKKIETTNKKLLT